MIYQLDSAWFSVSLCFSWRRQGN